MNLSLGFMWIDECLMSYIKNDMGKAYLNGEWVFVHVWAAHQRHAAQHVPKKHTRRAQQDLNLQLSDCGHEHEAVSP